MTEQDLIKLCKKEDPRAQKLLFYRFIDPVSRVCLRYLHNEQDTVEVVSEGFLKVYKHINSFEYKGEGSLFGWIRKIMINESLMHLRKHKKLQMHTDINEAYDQAATDHFAEHIEAEYLYQAIQNLPHGYSTVFNLYEIEGYSHKEIADELGITESASRSQLAKAKARLRQLLET